MNEKHFRELFQKLVESGQLSSKAAEELLKRILKILYSQNKKSKD